MKNLKKIIIALLLGFAGLNMNAQQEAMFTHYMYNTLAVNPAYAGSRDAITATVLHRSQWVSFKGAPTTQTLTVHGPLKSKKIGLGLSVVNDKIGPIRNTAAYADFAYILKLTEKSNLAFGLKGGINYMQANLSALVLDNQSDAAFENNISSKILPNFGFGMYYSTEKFYAGISAPKLLENNFITKETSFSTKITQEIRHYYVIAGAVFKLSENIDLKPTTFVKVTTGAPIEADLTTTFIFKKKLNAGVMFRTGDAVGVLVGYSIADQFHIGYSFDWSYGLKSFKYNNGSHEIMLSYDIFGKGKEKSKARFF
jgi:type IX secretion system PorP/SprF family membrane protein